MLTRIRFRVDHKRVSADAVSEAVRGARKVLRYLGSGVVELSFREVDDEIVRLVESLAAGDTFASFGRVDVDPNELRSDRLYMLNRSSRGAGVTEADANRSGPVVVEPNGVQSYVHVVRRGDVAPPRCPELRSSNEIFVEFVASPRGVEAEQAVLPFVVPVSRVDGGFHEGFGFLCLRELPPIRVRSPAVGMGLPFTELALVADTIPNPEEAYASTGYAAADGTSYLLLRGDRAAIVLREWKYVGFTPVLTIEEWTRYYAKFRPIADALRGQFRQEAW